VKRRKLVESRFHGGVALDGDADVEIERHHQRGGGVRFEEVGHFGAHDQDVRELQNGTRLADRGDEAIAERHGWSI
jgi:hypothetical protein